MRDAKTKQAFIDFLQDPKNKDLRFWQALYVFMKNKLIYVSDYPSDDPKMIDTFYIEADKETQK